MTAQKHLICKTHEGGVTEIILNRAPVNALSAEFLMDFRDLITALDADETVKAIVLTSDFKVFSAGLDLKAALSFDVAQQHGVVAGLNEGFLALFACSKPTVVAVAGAAIAGGLFFVLASDLRVAGPRARFGLAEVQVGADFPVGPMEIARHTLGPNALRRLMLTGVPVDAGTAHTFGIVDELTEAGDERDRALALGREMATRPPKTYGRIKKQIRGDVIAALQDAIATGANTPEGGWFNDETKAAMQRMIG